MTYGTLPGRRAFLDAFNRETGGADYRIESRGEMADYIDSGEYAASDLYKIVEDLAEQWNEGDDEAGSVASSILETLGFEWV